MFKKNQTALINIDTVLTAVYGEQVIAVPVHEDTIAIWDTVKEKVCMFFNVVTSRFYSPIKIEPISDILNISDLDQLTEFVKVH